MRRGAAAVVALLLALIPVAACSSGGGSGSADDRPGDAGRVTIDQSTPEALVYTLLLANANGQTDDVSSVMNADNTRNPWAVDDPSEIVYCNAEGTTCDYYGAQLHDGSCPAAVTDVEALKDNITVEYKPASPNGAYGENMRAHVTAVEDSCGFETFNVEGKWVVLGN